MTIILHATKSYRLPRHKRLRSGLYLGQYIGTPEGDAIIKKLELVDEIEHIEAEKVSDGSLITMSLSQVRVPSWSDEWIFYGFRKLGEVQEERTYILFPIMARSIAEAIEAFKAAHRAIDGVVVSP